MILVLFFVLAVLGRTVGLPEAWKQRLLRELSSRGLEVEVKKITMDPLGGLVARDLVVYRDSRRGEERLRVRRVELTPNWLAWRSGEPFLSGARLRDAHVAWPLGEGVEAEARRVEAALEFRPSEIRIQRLRGQVLGFDLDLKGRVGTEAGRQPAPQEFPIAKAWQQAERVLRDLGGPAPKIQAEFSVEIGRPEESRAEVLVTSARNVWRGVAIPSLEVRATMAEGALKLERCQLQLEPGGVEAFGWADFSRGAGGLEFFGRFDPAALAPAVGQSFAYALREFKAQQLPQIRGKMETNWKGEKGVYASGRLEIGEFRLGLFPFRSFLLPWVTDGQRWMIQGFQLEAAAGGRIEAQVAFDGKAELKGNLRSDLDLRGLAPLFGPGGSSLLVESGFCPTSPDELPDYGGGLFPGFDPAGRAGAGGGNEIQGGFHGSSFRGRGLRLAGNPGHQRTGDLRGRGGQGSAYLYPESAFCSFSQRGVHPRGAGIHPGLWRKGAGNHAPL